MVSQGEVGATPFSTRCHISWAKQVDNELILARERFCSAVIFGSGCMCNSVFLLITTDDLRIWLGNHLGMLWEPFQVLLKLVFKHIFRASQGMVFSLLSLVIILFFLFWTSTLLGVCSLFTLDLGSEEKNHGGVSSTTLKLVVANLGSVFLTIMTFGRVHMTTH